MNFDCLSITARVSGPDAALRRIGHYFPVAESSAAPIVFLQLHMVSDKTMEELRASIREFQYEQVSWGHPELRYEIVSDGSTTRYFIPLTDTPHVISISNGHAINVWATDPVTLGRTAVRVLRQLMLRRAELAGGMGGHAAALAQAGNGIVVAGKPAAGKTTVSLNLAANNSEFNLVASDRLVFRPEGPRGWRVAALPVPWRIAAGTINALPCLRQTFDEGISLYRGNHLVGGKNELVTAELAAALRTGVAFSAPLRHLVVLERTSSGAPPRVDLVTPAAGCALLMETLFHADDMLFNRDWFGGHKVPSARMLNERARSMADSLPVYHATWSEFSDLATLVPQLKELLQER